MGKVRGEWVHMYVRKAHAIEGVTPGQSVTVLERNGLKDTTEMKASELVPLLKKTGAYGADKFMQLIQF